MDPNQPQPIRERPRPDQPPGPERPGGLAEPRPAPGPQPGSAAEDHGVDRESRDDPLPQAP